MSISFTPELGWIDVPDPDNPPVGAIQITASDLLRYENLGKDTEAALAAQELVEDPARPGIYLMGSP